MSNFLHTYHTPVNTPTPPPEIIYIYYLKGRLKPENEKFDESFLGNWYEEGFSFLFFSQSAHDHVKKLLLLQTDLTLLDKFHMTYDEWHGSAITPIRIGRFLISPPWGKPENTKEAIKSELHLTLDPGVVFGTGTHPTTHACLQALEFACDQVHIQTVLDLGTGTGLLALAAASLNCDRILAVDFNYLSAKTAKNNVRLNRLEDKILVVQGQAENFVDFSSDLVIANIHYDIIRRLLDKNGFWEKKWVILSGLLHSQAVKLTSQLSQSPFKIIKQWDHEGIWHTFLGQTS